MTKSEMFDIVNDLDGNGLVVTDNRLLFAAINNMEELETDSNWQNILEENTEDTDDY